VSLLSSSGWYLFVMAWRGDGGYGSLDGSGEVREVVGGSRLGCT
jgi:hypothetical protein